MQLKPYFAAAFIFVVVVVGNLVLGATAGIPQRVRRAPMFSHILALQANEQPPTFTVVQPEVFFVSYGGSNSRIDSSVKTAPQTIRQQPIAY
uniref:Uncharacterized protein n=1 Tax=Anopheles atroparvus TaxID=41427 RepID=A0AAG5D1V8_ANOAO